MAILDRNNIIENNGVNNGIVAETINGGVIYNINNSIRYKIPSLIPSLINKLAELSNIPDDQMDNSYKITKGDLQEYRIEDKIEYNNVIKYKDIIDEYCEYGSICDEAFNIIDNNDSGIKRKILKSINFIYKKEKGEVLRKHVGEVSMQVIRDNSDTIIQNVIDELKNRIYNDEDGQKIYIEDVEEGLSRIICYAFVECKILEKPKKVTEL